MAVVPGWGAAGGTEYAGTGTALEALLTAAPEPFLVTANAVNIDPLRAPGSTEPGTQPMEVGSALIAGTDRCARVRVVAAPRAPQARRPHSRLSADRAARYPLMPWTPPPGGVDEEQR